MKRRSSAQTCSHESDNKGRVTFHALFSECLSPPRVIFLFEYLATIEKQYNDRPNQYHKIIRPQWTMKSVPQD
ncbi:hypothetical protein STEG23_016642, partial [Scotinomys teguina]